LVQLEHITGQSKTLITKVPEDLPRQLVPSK